MSALDVLSPEAQALFAQACRHPDWTVADGQEDACRELGHAGLVWWARPEAMSAWPEGLRGHTILTPYPAARQMGREMSRG